MNCVDAERLFDAFLDGELSGALRLELDAHRLRCHICQQKLAMLDACEHVIAAESRSPRLSADFTDRVMSVVGDRAAELAARRRRRMRIGLAVSLQAAAAVGALVFVPRLLNRGGPAPIESVPAILATSTWEKELETAIEQRNESRLSEMIWQRYGDLRAAGDNLSNDVGALSTYAIRLTDPARQARASSLDPLSWVLGLFDAGQAAPPSTTDDPYSL